MPWLGKAIESYISELSKGNEGGKAHLPADVEIHVEKPNAHLEVAGSSASILIEKGGITKIANEVCKKATTQLLMTEPDRGWFGKN